MIFWDFEFFVYKTGTLEKRNFIHALGKGEKNHIVQYLEPKCTKNKTSNEQNCEE